MTGLFVISKGKPSRWIQFKQFTRRMGNTWILDPGFDMDCVRAMGRTRGLAQHFQVSQSKPTTGGANPENDTQKTLADPFWGGQTSLPIPFWSQRHATDLAKAPIYTPSDNQPLHGTKSSISGSW